MTQLGWLGEVHRLLPFKTQFVLYGNVGDRFPILAEEQADPSQVCFAPLTVSLPETLKHWGYQVVGIHDIIDGLRFCGGPDEKERQRREFCTLSTAEHCSSGKEDPAALDVAATLSRIRRAVQNSKTPCAFVLESAFLLSRGPTDLDEPERGRFLTVMKCGREANKVRTGERLLPNILILVAPKLNDFPP